jgi:hypothetical protein
MYAVQQNSVSELPSGVLLRDRCAPRIGQSPEVRPHGPEWLRAFIRVIVRSARRVFAETACDGKGFPVPILVLEF